jgi:hypothetical protein
VFCAEGIRRVLRRRHPTSHSRFHLPDRHGNGPPLSRARIPGTDPTKLRSSLK